jgi:NADPH:quinone reductase-like Zn-dependent oxidoreductase
MADPWRSYRMPAAGERLREFREPLPQPQGTEVLVRITASGVCHSDVHFWDGFFDLGNGRKADLTRTAASSIPGSAAASATTAVPGAKSCAPARRRSSG